MMNSTSKNTMPKYLERKLSLLISHTPEVLISAVGLHVVLLNAHSVQNFRPVLLNRLQFFQRRQVLRKL